MCADGENGNADRPYIEPTVYVGNSRKRCRVTVVVATPKALSHYRIESKYAANLKEKARPQQQFRSFREDNVISEVRLYRARPRRELFMGYVHCSVAASRFIEGRNSICTCYCWYGVLPLLKEAKNQQKPPRKSLPTSCPNANAIHHHISNPPPLATLNPP
jgi:hypothetical protein